MNVQRKNAYETENDKNDIDGSNGRTFAVILLRQGRQGSLPVLDRARPQKREAGTDKNWRLERHELFAVKVKPEEYPDYYETTSPRGELYLSAIWPDYLSVKEERISIPKGQQADSVYAYSSRLNTNCEKVRDVVRMHKQFTTVHLKMQIPDGFDSYPYRVFIRGNTAGWDVRDFSGTDGMFEYEPELEGQNEFSVRVPRQADKGLTAEVYSANEKVDEFRLGEIISQAGFDWNAEELADISLEVNFTTSTVLAHISDWLDTIILNVKM